MIKMTPVGAPRAWALWPCLSCAGVALAGAIAVAAPAAAQSAYPITATQRATAQQVAAAGVPLSALAPDAPQEYTVQHGDTLWRISGLYLRSPWRWPELWGMNLQDIHNPHLIYPGQQLYLERVGNRAILRARQVMDGQEGATVRVSPRNRVEMLDASPLPTLEPGLIEPFLTESLIVDDGVFKQAPHVVAVRNSDHMIASMSEQAYVLGPADAPVRLASGQPTDYQIFRESKPLKDPVSGDVLGYEAQYVGRATVLRGQGDTVSNKLDAPGARTRDTSPPFPESGNLSATPQSAPAQRPGGAAQTDKGLPVPATIRIDSSQEEVRPGDRLLPTPPRQWRSYAPHAPAVPIDARVVKVFGDETVRYAGQDQIVVINKGLRDGIETGQVLMVLTAGQRMKDPGGHNAQVRLPDERNGLAMVFRPFERASYALIMNITNPVQTGDKLVNPQ
ncbi:MAG: LysM peptidoglycan-binding domain-containing protein [Burkholderiaceae bacterium]|nr:LysM peptidoglycan-binding domain-containing protein [Burkholderiaceae bacterium]